MNKDRETGSRGIAIASLGVALSFLASGILAAERKIVPRYERGAEPTTVDRPKPARKPLPDALRLARPAAEPVAAAAQARVGSTAEAPARATRPHALPPQSASGHSVRLDRMARDAARWMALEVVRDAGAREYYRIGFYEGLRIAMADPTPDRWEYAAGLRHGRRDPEAREAGFDLGDAAAEDRARVEAESQVADQFTDLSRQPRHFPRASRPRYEPGPAAVPTPLLQAVVADFPLSRFSFLAAADRRHFDDWSYDPWKLRACESYVEFYRPGWRDAASAFDAWTRIRRESAFYRTLRAIDQRNRFRAVFIGEFNAQLGALFEAHLQRTYDRAFDDGFFYGAFVHSEWSYRQGYHEGFVEALTSASVSAFERNYLRAYDLWYGRSFRDWSENPKPAIGSVRLTDGNEDGVFEPGETIRVAYELINYGGREGIVPLGVDSSILTDTGRSEARIAARGVTRSPTEMTVRISERTPSRTNAVLDFSMGDQLERIPLTVNYPLQFRSGGVQLLRDNLAGDVRVEIAVSNISRMPRGGTVELTTFARPDFRDARRLETVAGGREDSLSFRIRDLDPLELIAGSVELTFEIRSEGKVHDTYRHRLPNVARDLRNRDLLLYTMEMARDGRATPARISTVHDLLMMRLREDWSVAASGRGNPYKDDLKTRGTRTALGDLVQAYLAEKHRITQPEVFHGLESEIGALSQALPGVHPRLRKQMRKLAAPLP